MPFRSGIDGTWLNAIERCGISFQKMLHIGEQWNIGHWVGLNEGIDLMSFA